MNHTNPVRLFNLVCIFFLLSCFEPAHAKSKRTESIPFRMVGSYVMVDVSINNSPPLSFIIDTGIRTSIIADLGENDSIQFFSSDSISIQGLGGGDNLRALRFKNNKLEIGKLDFHNTDIIVLIDKTFNLSNITGEKINGILGSDILEDYIVEINYQTNRINFFEHSKFQLPKKYTAIPTLLINHKLYVNADIVNADDSVKKVVMLLDTGAEVGAWLQNISNKGVRIPDKNVFGYIGEGLNGEIFGHYAYAKSLCLGPYCIKKPIITFPDSIYISQSILNSSRDGTLGNQILKRFDLIVDFKTPALYLRPNQMLQNSFSYNIAGIELLQDYPRFYETRVSKVWKDSPADKKGVKIDDLILEVDKQPVFTLKLSEIRNIFETPRRLPLHLVIQRENEVIDVFLDMRSAL